MCTTVNANALIYWSHSTLLFVENNEYYNIRYHIILIIIFPNSNGIIFSHSLLLFQICKKKIGKEFPYFFSQCYYMVLCEFTYRYFLKTLNL